MKKYFCIVCILAGCSSGGGDSYDDLGRPTGNWCLVTHGYEEAQFDDETNILLNPTISEVGNFYAFISFEEMVEEYKDVEACAAPEAMTPGPTVNFTSFNHLGTYGLAFYTYATQGVYINVDENEGPQRNCLSDRLFLRHEYMHHILHLNGESSEHSNPKFGQCNALGPKTCNGEYCE